MVASIWTTGDLGLINWKVAGEEAHALMRRRILERLQRRGLPHVSGRIEQLRSLTDDFHERGARRRQGQTRFATTGRGLETFEATHRWKPIAEAGGTARIRGRPVRTTIQPLDRPEQQPHQASTPCRRNFLDDSACNLARSTTKFSRDGHGNMTEESRGTAPMPHLPRGAGDLVDLSRYPTEGCAGNSTEIFIPARSASATRTLWARSHAARRSVRQRHKRARESPRRSRRHVRTRVPRQAGDGREARGPSTSFAKNREPMWA